MHFSPYCRAVLYRYLLRHISFAYNIKQFVCHLIKPLLTYLLTYLWKSGFELHSRDKTRNTTALKSTDMNHILSSRQQSAFHTGIYFVDRAFIYTITDKWLNFFHSSRSRQRKMIFVLKLLILSVRIWTTAFHPFHVHASNGRLLATPLRSDLVL